MTDNGWIKRNTIIWYKRNAMPCSTQDRFTVDFEPIYMFTRSKNYNFNIQYEPLAKSTIRKSETSSYIIKKGKSVGTTQFAVDHSVDWKPNTNGRQMRCVWDIKPMSNEELSWLAACIDGEGSLYINIQKRNNIYKTYFRPCIEVTMSSEAMINKCFQITQTGSVYHRQKGQGGKFVSTWRVSGDAIISILEQIYPFLLLKKKQSELLLELNSLNESGRNQFSKDETFEHRREIAERVKLLNHTQYDYVPCGSLNEVDLNSSIWDIPTQPSTISHFAMYPQPLVERCILSGSNEGDVVLDPFCGAGTTGIVAIKNNRKFIGIELSEKYMEIARKRIKETENARENLFS
jgi:DNA modification methylase